MRQIHLVPIAATHTECGRPRGDFAPTDITLIPEHATCPGCFIDDSMEERILRRETSFMRCLNLEEL